VSLKSLRVRNPPITCLPPPSPNPGKSSPFGDANTSSPMLRPERSARTRCAQTPPPQHLLSLNCIEDVGLGESLEILWELEPGAAIDERIGLPELAGFDPPRAFDAFLNAVRWGAISASDDRALQAPFRSGNEIEDYQLDPLVRAIQMPRGHQIKCVRRPATGYRWPTGESIPPSIARSLADHHACGSSIAKTDGSLPDASAARLLAGRSTMPGAMSESIRRTQASLTGLGESIAVNAWSVQQCQLMT
jgi:hypothetical protein